DQIYEPTQASRGPAQELAARRPDSGAGRPAGQRGPAPPAPLVAGRVPDRCGLLLDSGLHPGYCGARSRSALTHSHPAHRAADPLRGPADVPPRRRGEPARARFDLDAREASLVLEGQAVRARPTGLRGDRLAGYDHPLCGGRHGPHRRESTGAGVLRRPPGRHHPRAVGGARRGLPQGFQRSHRPRGPPGRGVPVTQPGSRGRRLLRDRCEPPNHHQLAELAAHQLREPAGDDHRVSGGVPAARARSLGLRNRREHDAARAWGARGQTRAPRGPHPQHAQDADHS
ncbi:MAG: putative membrane protein, partial [uncultured Rubrobacteraceae bacterium]